VAPRVTALVAEPRGRVRVELDGATWRVLPTGAVVGAQLSVGTELDRVRARTLRRELRALEALAFATATLSRRDHSTSGLDAKLVRRGVAPSERARALDTLERAGYVDDTRFATRRAASLAERGYGDDAIRFDLEQHGLDERFASLALSSIEPEPRRAARFVARRGSSARTARWLASRGFCDDSIEGAVGESEPFGFDE
jgi:regulatory protein